MVRACGRAVRDHAAVVRRREEDVMRDDNGIRRSEERFHYYEVLIVFFEKRSQRRFRFFGVGCICVFCQSINSGDMIEDVYWCSLRGLGRASGRWRT